MKKLILSGALLCSLPVAVTPGFAQAGHLDPAFGTNGVVENTLLTSFSEAAIAPDGDIVVAGTTGGIATLVRYLPSGALDPTFGTDGVVSLPPPASFFLGESFTLAMAIQSNGEILATYYAFNNTSTDSESLLIRLTSSGVLDATFGSGGSVPLSFPVPASWGASVTEILAQPDGKILVTGNIVPPFRNHSAPLTLLARYLSNGALDTTFGTGGISEVVTSVDLPTSLALLSGDGILALDGTGTIGVDQFTSAGALLAAPTGGTITELSNTGDTAFEQNGEFLIAETVAGPDGKTNVDAVVKRFELNGAADASFESPAIRLVPDAINTKNIPAAVTVDSLGRVIVGAEVESANFGSGIARLNANGSLDSTFGTDGSGTLVPGFVVFTVLVQPNNQIVMVGSSGNLARYLAK
jgi:uncharacterized delta-60 repeat protein